MADMRVEEIPHGEDPSLVMEFVKNDIPASIKITLHFEGDWSNMYDDIDESEDEARAEVAAQFLQRAARLFEQ